MPPWLICCKAWAAQCSKTWMPHSKVDSQHEAPRISKDGKRYGVQLKFNDNVYGTAEVEIKYGPDQQNMPNLILPAAQDRRTLVGSD